MTGEPRDHRPQAPHVRAAPSVAGDAAPFSDEGQLLARALDNDAVAFRTLVDRHLASVVVLARHLLNDASEAEDVAQEAFVRLWQGADALEVGEHGVRPWLRRVARNLAIDRLRATKRLDVVDDLPERGEAPRQQSDLEGEERRARVAEAVAGLPERQRVALTLFHFEHVSQIEIAAALDASVDAVESLLARARRSLKAELEDEWQMLLADVEPDYGGDGI